MYKTFVAKENDVSEVATVLSVEFINISLSQILKVLMYNRYKKYIYVYCRWATGIKLVYGGNSIKRCVLFSFKIDEYIHNQES